MGDQGRRSVAFNRFNIRTKFSFQVGSSLRLGWAVWWIRMSKWTAAKASKVKETGQDLSCASHAPDPSHPTSPWIAAQVPGTVLNALVDANLVPDPYISTNSKDIPDIGDVGREEYTYWFCTTFEIDPARFLEHKRQFWWLQMNGVNYSFSLYLNGAQIPVSNNKGMFLRRVLDVSTHVLPGKNYLAVLVNPPDHPGKIPPTGGQGGDHQLAQDVCSQFFQGWDWIIATPDRSTGIWRDIGLRPTGVLRLSDLYAAAQFPPEVTAALSKNPRCDIDAVPVRVGVTLCNPTEADVDAVLLLQILHCEHAEQGLGDGDDEDVVVLDLATEAEVTVPAGQSIDFVFPPQNLKRPQLWWPVGMGAQPLYTVEVQACTSGQTLRRARGRAPRGGEGAAALAEEDAAAASFGVRELSSHVDAATGGRLFEVNGQRVFIHGGNYIASDAMLRQPAARVWEEARLLALGNVNMLRCWGGAGCQGEALYAACDAWGVLVWVEFWITGDDDGRGSGDSQYPLDHGLFLRCAEDVLRAVRGHPSVALYVGGNEQQPCQELNEALGPLVQRLDPARAYVRGSLWDGFADGHGGDGYLHLHDGPYCPQEPRAFHREGFYRYGFNPEIGSVGLPEVESVAQVLPAAMREPPRFVRDTAAKTGWLTEEVPPAWSHHKYMPYGKLDRGVPNQIALYGVPASLAEFCLQAQMANFVQYRAMAEGHIGKMWRKHTGMLVWKIQGPWPGFLGQFYDAFLRPNAALYGFRCGASPLHCQLCPVGGGRIQAVNHTPAAASVAVQLRAIALDGTLLASAHVLATLPPASVSDVLPALPQIPCAADQVFFLHLALAATADEAAAREEEASSVAAGSDLDCRGPPAAAVLEENLYWVTKNGMDDAAPPSQEEFLALRDWKASCPASVHAQAEGTSVASPSTPMRPSGHGILDLSTPPPPPTVPTRHFRIQVSISNAHPSNVALFLRLRLLLTPASPTYQPDAALLPAVISDNYFSLLPESVQPPQAPARKITVDFSLPPAACELAASKSKPPVELRVSGFNLKEQCIPIKWN